MGITKSVTLLDVANSSFGKAYAEWLSDQIDQGWMSARYAANLLDCTIEDLQDMFRKHGLKYPEL